jgi:arylsulfatase A-like enzyme
LEGPETFRTSCGRAAKPQRETDVAGGSLQLKGESMVLQIHSWIRRLGALTLAMGFILVGIPHGRLQVKAEPQTRKPNIVIIWGDDVGQSDISAYSMGLMGFHTPNIDRVAKEGMIFTDYYAEQSCTAGRSSFITGQSGLRTGNTKVGMPGAAQGLQARDVTIAELLKGQGYATAQFGKNHLGDRNEYLPTAHGFDEFFGPLYHLNASEEPELPDYPKESDFPNFLKNFGPRGVLDCKATNVDDPTVDPRFGKMGKQTCTDSGPLTKKRMETVDDEFAERSVEYLSVRMRPASPCSSG